ncbi:MAG: dephospho-CoA kinase [Anaerolineales bacterium]|nr:MAG: dephospho-CoA kinase [Anaerolineales bacterium]
MNQPRPLLIGLTGNLGTGKSTVAATLAELGAETVDADKVGHEVMRADTEAHAAVVQAFGPGILAPDGEIDRPRLASLAFADSVALERLEAIIHPPTIAAIDERVAASTASVFVIEAIKLIEAGMADRCDRVWVTTCDAEQQFERVMEGRGWTLAETRRRLQAQSPQDEKASRADVVIDTSVSFEHTRAQVEAAWAQLRESGLAA